MLENPTAPPATALVWPTNSTSSGVEKVYFRLTKVTSTANSATEDKLYTDILVQKKAYSCQSCPGWGPWAQKHEAITGSLFSSPVPRRSACKESTESLQPQHSVKVQDRGHP